jgi:hypothetical protein
VGVKMELSVWDVKTKLTQAVHKAVADLVVSRVFSDKTPDQRLSKADLYRLERELVELFGKAGEYIYIKVINGGEENG